MLTYQLCILLHPTVCSNASYHRFNDIITSIIVCVCVCMRECEKLLKPVINDLINMKLVLGDIEKLRCRYDMRKISRYNDIHDISCMVLFRKQTILFVYILVFK